MPRYYSRRTFRRRRRRRGRRPVYRRRRRSGRMARRRFRARVSRVLVNMAEKKRRQIVYAEAPISPSNTAVYNTMFAVAGGTEVFQRIGRKIKPLSHQIRIDLQKNQAYNASCRILFILPIITAEEIGEPAAQAPSDYFLSTVENDFLPRDNVPFRYKVLWDKTVIMNVQNINDQSRLYLRYKWRPKFTCRYDNAGNTDPIRWNPFLVITTENGYLAAGDFLNVNVSSKMLFTDI